MQKMGGETERFAHFHLLSHLDGCLNFVKFFGRTQSTLLGL